MADQLKIEELTLGSGSHPPGSCTPCIEEARTLYHGWDWGDRPTGDSPVIAAFLRAWNDSLNDEDRQQLKRYIDVAPTKGTPEQEDARAWMALDWLVRTYTPAWLRLAGLTEQADNLAGLAEFKAGMDVPAIRPAINAVRDDARAAGAAARAAAGDAAVDAAVDAAWAAAWAAAGDAAVDAAWAAAGAAARAAAVDAAREAARAAAVDAAVDAARDAAGDAAVDAARDAARAALRPTVENLHELAHELIARMIAA